MSAKFSDSDRTGILRAISEAEEVRNPVDDLVERVTKDPSSELSSDDVIALEHLRVQDDEGFERIRTALRKAGCRSSALDMPENDVTASSKPSSAAEILLQITSAYELFHAPDGTAYAFVPVDGHVETVPVGSSSMRDRLIVEFYKTTGRALTTEPLNTLIATLEAQARIDGSERDVFVRVGGHEGRLYIDLGSKEWSVIEVDQNGWRKVERSPIPFRRSPGMKELSDPIRGGRIDLVKPFLNLRDDADFVMFVSWALMALRPFGPYPVLVLSGEQGTAKSAFTEIARSLVDPNVAPIRSKFRDERELHIAANNAHILAFDNVSDLSGTESDAICRLATGGSSSVRRLYSDSEEMLFSATRAIILNGIPDLVGRPDLADRSIMIQLEPIPESARRPMADLRRELDQKRPEIFGALLDALVVGLAKLPEVDASSLPRMADFARWGIACETAYRPAGSFEKAYHENREKAVDATLEADHVANAVYGLMRIRGTWQGTATALLSSLGRIAGPSTTTSAEWPHSPKALSDSLRRSATFLRNQGVEISFTKEGKQRIRTITLTQRDGGQLFLEKTDARRLVRADVADALTIPKSADGRLDFNLRRANT
jgi:hypothetical protein